LSTSEGKRGPGIGTRRRRIWDELMELEIDDLEMQATRTLTLLRDLLVAVSNSRRTLSTWSTFTPARYALLHELDGGLQLICEQHAGYANDKVCAH